MFPKNETSAKIRASHAKYPAPGSCADPWPLSPCLFPFFPRPRGGVLRSAIYIEHVHKCHVLVAARSASKLAGHRSLLLRPAYTRGPMRLSSWALALLRVRVPYASRLVLTHVHAYNPTRASVYRGVCVYSSWRFTRAEKGGLVFLFIVIFFFFSFIASSHRMACQDRVRTAD